MDLKEDYFGSLWPCQPINSTRFESREYTSLGFVRLSATNVFMQLEYKIINSTVLQLSLLQSTDNSYQLDN